MDDGLGERSLFEDIFGSTNKSDAFDNPQLVDITAIDQASRYIYRSLRQVGINLRPGMSTMRIADLVHASLIADRVDPGSIIIRVSPENVVWHGIPSSSFVKSGEIVTVDVACSLRGWWADAAYTFPVGEIDADHKNLLESAMEGTRRAASMIKEGNRGRELADRLNSLCRERQVNLVSEAAGHRIGRRLHDDPIITYDGVGHPKLELGLVYTAEPIFTSGSGEIEIAGDGSAVTADGEASAHFEISALCLRDGSQILGAPSWI